MPTMDRDEYEAFLSEPGQLVRIGNLEADGMPNVTPTWYKFDKGKVHIGARLHAAWTKNLQRDPRVCLIFDENGGVYRKVIAQGEITFVHGAGEDDLWREEVFRPLCLGYLPPEAVDKYLADTIDAPRALLELDLRSDDVKVRAWRQPSPDLTQDNVDDYFPARFRGGTGA